MPLYDFECRDCGKVSEVLLRTSGQVPHAADGASVVRRLLAPPEMCAAEVEGMVLLNLDPRNPARGNGWQ